MKKNVHSVNKFLMYLRAFNILLINRNLWEGNIMCIFFKFIWPGNILLKGSASHWSSEDSTWDSADPLCALGFTLHCCPNIGLCHPQPSLLRWPPCLHLCHHWNHLYSQFCFSNRNTWSFLPLSPKSTSAFYTDSSPGPVYVPSEPGPAHLPSFNSTTLTFSQNIAWICPLSDL